MKYDDKKLAKILEIKLQKNNLYNLDSQAFNINNEQFIVLKAEQFNTLMYLVRDSVKEYLEGETNEQ